MPAEGRGVRISILLLAASLFCVSVSLPAQEERDSPPKSQDPAAEKSPPATLTVPAGERLVLELETPLHTKVTRADAQAEFITYRDLIVGRRVVIPQGSRVVATVVRTRRAGRVRGRAEMKLRFDTVKFPDGTLEPFAATLVSAGLNPVGGGGKMKDPGIEGDNDTEREIRIVLNRTGQGAIIGSIAGGGKGALYGTAIGAGIGLVSILLERGPDLDLPRGMLFEVELTDELSVPRSVTYAVLSAASDGAGEEEGADLEATGPEAEAEEEEATGSEGAEAAATETDSDSGEAAGADKSDTPGVLPRPAPRWNPALPPPDPGFTFTVDVRLVLVEAVVRGPGGQVMAGLEKEDFRVFEDGVEQEVKHFSRDEFPLALALVVDRSGSVASYMPELRRAARQTLGYLKEGDAVALFAFASEPELIEELTEDRQRVAGRIQKIRPGGGTNISDAVYAAAEYLAEAAPDRRRAILLISDNQNKARGENSETDLIRALLETETIVYSIRTPGELSFGSFKPAMPFERLVRKITRETGGEILDVERRRTLTRALEAVIQRFKLRYTLGYASAHKERDGRFREIEVRLNQRFGEAGRNYNTHHRRGYYALDAVSSAETSR